LDLNPLFCIGEESQREREREGREEQIKLNNKNEIIILVLQESPDPWNAAFSTMYAFTIHFHISLYTYSFLFTRSL
jgi:hypothetical protein